MVLATDNPIEYEGTYPLPEAQLDRFIARVRLGYLDPAGEAEMARRRLAAARRRRSRARSPTPPRCSRCASPWSSVHLDPDILDYIVRLSPRPGPTRRPASAPARAGTLAVIQLARGHAVLESRDYVTPEDVKAVAVPALAHRLVLRPEMWVRRVTGEDVIGEILAALPVPRAG